MPFQKGHKINIGRILSYETKRKIGKANKIALKGIIPWNKGLKMPYIARISIRGKPTWNVGRKMDDYPQMCFRKGHPNFAPNGEKHYRWIEDRDILMKNLRNDPEYKQWVRQVKKRDNNTCKLKDENCSGYNIVHHIKGWVKHLELRYEIKNGITLCQAHHPRTRAEEKRLEPIFQALVLISNEPICQILHKQN